MTLADSEFTLRLIHLLVCQHRAALECWQVAVEQGSARSVVLTENCTVDVMEAIARH